MKLRTSDLERLGQAYGNKMFDMLERTCRQPDCSLYVEMIYVWQDEDCKGVNLRPDFKCLAENCGVRGVDCSMMSRIACQAALEQTGLGTKLDLGGPIK